MAIHDRYIFDNEASIPPGIAAAIQGVISNWDILPSDGWADFCTDDVEILLAGQHAQGFQATKTMRDSTFNVTNGPLVGVQHTLQDVYLKATSAAEGATTDVFFTGTVVYTVLGGKVLSEDFATFYALQNVGPNQYKVKTMRIYIDTAALGLALAELQKLS